MQIKDLYGKEITVTDMDEAIKQTDMFRKYSDLDAPEGQSEFDRERKAYWTDLHEKLLELQSAF
jgi:hypothetical protein